MKRGGKSHREASDDNVTYLMSQADRARALAVSSPSPLVAELLNLHAKCCEENAARKAAKVRRRRGSG